MTFRYAKILIFIGLFLFGCESNDKRKYEEEYKEFIKKREKKVLGVDAEALRNALRLYPEFKQSGLSKNFDIFKFREFSKTNNINSLEFLPIFAMISEVDESSKTETGRVYVENKYPLQIVEAIRSELAIQ